MSALLPTQVSVVQFVAEGHAVLFVQLASVLVCSFASRSAAAPLNSLSSFTDPTGIASSPE